VLPLLLFNGVLAMDNLERAAMDFSSKVIDPVRGMSVDFGLSKKRLKGKIFPRE